jgi:hypothetical protein
MPRHIRVGLGCPPDEFARGFEQLNAEIDTTFLARRHAPAVTTR